MLKIQLSPKAGQTITRLADICGGDLDEVASAFVLAMVPQIMEEAEHIANDMALGTVLQQLREVRKDCRRRKR